MKQTTIFALLLTFFSFLLILSAALLFLWQGRQALEANIGQLQTEQNQLQDQQLALETALETQIVHAEQLQTENEGLQQLLATRTTMLQTPMPSHTPTPLSAATPNITATMPALSLPQIQFIRPISGTRLEIGKPAEIIVVATDNQGIAQIKINEQATAIAALSGENQMLQVAETSWTPLSAGTYTLTAIVTNTQGIASVPAQILVTVSSVGDAHLLWHFHQTHLLWQPVRFSSRPNRLSSVYPPF